SAPVSAVPSPSSSPTPTPEPTDPGPTLGPNADYAPLDGVLANANVRARLPVAVMVDDNVQARPQYGFNSASIVYQAPADGGETRYMMIFQEKDATRVEPVRSGRPYFVNWASEYRSAFAHYGGDLKTRTYLPTIDKKVIYNMDALAGSGSAFHRDKARKAPHNAVGNTTSIRKLAVARGAPATFAPSLGVRPFADDLPLAQRPAKGSIKIPYNRGATSYTYDRANNRYLRSVAGKAQTDAADGKRVTARNVVVLFMRYSIDPESEPGYHRPVFDHVGSGTALVFRDGLVIKGTWKKPSSSALTRFYDAAGNEISLVRGPIFIQVEPLGAKVTYDAKPAP
ncbi:MAG TPA: DUF3048 domain-containing protein, partial [Candidatus Limnocylindrales bacterium]